MSRRIFIHLPVAELRRSVAFFEAVGFSHEPRMSEGDTACIVASETIYVMLLAHSKFRELSLKEVCDTSRSLETLLTLECAGRDEVDGLVSKAVGAGGSTIEEAQDYGFMYSHGFVDPDGHHWGLVSMAAEPAGNGSETDSPDSGRA